MTSSSFTLALSQQDINKVVLESSNLLNVLGLPIEANLADRMQQKIANFQPFEGLKTMTLNACGGSDGNCSWA